jgi:hypothetical protein
MARPQPTIMLEKIDNTTHKIDQVLHADAIWAVFYKNGAINLRNIPGMMSYAAPLYKKTSFSNPGHARNLASKLNNQFTCNDFTVVKLANGTLDK